jgi:hypothetical protein
MLSDRRALAINFALRIIPANNVKESRTLPPHANRRDARMVDLEIAGNNRYSTLIPFMNVEGRSSFTCWRRLASQ